jgi:sulfur-carrier protein
MKNISIKYFASVREALGLSGEEVQTLAATVGQLRDELMARNALFAQTLGRDRAVRVALDHTMAQEDEVLSHECEVAFFPPVTGG